MTTRIIWLEVAAATALVCVALLPSYSPPVKLARLTSAGVECDAMSSAWSGGMGRTDHCSDPRMNGHRVEDWCGPQGCTMNVWYDQVGHDDLTTNAHLRPNCLNSRPCVVSDGMGVLAVSGGDTSATAHAYSVRDQSAR